MSALRQEPSLPPPAQPYVLLIENELDDEALAQRILKKYRISNHVDWVTDGEDALKLLRERLSVSGQGPAAGWSVAEPAQQVTRARSLEGASSGTSLLPASDPAQRTRDAGTSRPAEMRSAQAGYPKRAPLTPELILLSFDQKRLTALETVARMRALPGMENVPIAILCRTPDQERQVRESPLPRLSSLSKPIGFFKLLECIQRMDMHWFVFSEKP